LESFTWQYPPLHFSFAFGVEYDMSKNIYVGNLPWSATEDDVRAAFAEYGEVVSVKLINDRETGRPRGFGFVEMEDQGALAAIEALDGTDFGGRNIKVNEARPRPERPRW
jgi:RNA recognition motif-containing protein